MVIFFKRTLKVSFFILYLYFSALNYVFIYVILHYREMMNMNKIRIGIIGFGNRGEGMTKCILETQKNVEVAAVCDEYEDRAEAAAKLVFEAQNKKPFKTTDYKEVIKKEDIDAVMIFCAWESHIDVACAAMENGKYAAMEVGGAYSVDDCFRLVHTYERTGVPCMLLENCCYGQTELMVLNMVREGLFGEIVHCAGGYCHDLRYEIAGGNINRHYRLRNYALRCCENYPTHELGPIAKVLNINRGNRMVSLTSTASKAVGMHQYISDNLDKYGELANTRFAQGDIVTTVIKCAGGETITLTLDTTLPKMYSRQFTVRGTKGSYMEDTDTVYIDSVHHNEKNEFNAKNLWGNAEEYRKTHMHSLWKKYKEPAAKAGHDGMDFMVLSAFFEAVSKKAQTSIDVYDTAAWMSISAISEASIACGGAPQPIPDFTNGKWIKFAKEKSELEFSLD